MPGHVRKQRHCGTPTAGLLDLCRAFLAKVGACLSTALAAASAKHAQAVAEGKGLAALQALEAQLAPVPAAGAEAPPAEGTEGGATGVLKPDA